MSHYPTGVCVVTATDPDGSHLGFVVGTFNSVSLDPPLIGFYPDKLSSSWARISKVGKFCVNVLASGQQDLCSRFSSRLPDKFASVSHRVSENGSPILDAVVAWLDCSLEAEHEAGDHYIALGRVTNMAVERITNPLVFLKGQLVTVTAAESDVACAA